MFAYYVRLGFKRLRRNPILTGLMILTIAIGIAASMSTLTVLYMMSGNPIPEKSERLIVPLLDNGQLEDYIEGEEPPFQISYIDANNLLQQKYALRQTAIYGIASIIESDRKELPNFFTDGLAVTADFFPMFNVPFLYGGPWSADEDTNGTPVAVLSKSMSKRLFNHDDPIGRSFNANDRQYRVVGVIDDWQPLPRYYRLISGKATYGEIESIFIPLKAALAQEYRNNGSVQCNGPRSGDGFEGFLQSECTWIQFWFELAPHQSRSAMNDYLHNYITEQKKLGRYQRPINFATYDVMEWLEEREVIGNDSKLQSILAIGFLLVCLVNAVGLMLAKYGARAGEIGVRRALGANRRDIFTQFLIETGVIGLAGGALGLALSFAGLALIAQQSSSMETVATMNIEMLLATIGLAILATLLSGLLPTWRACQVKPAVQLKSQ